MSDRPPDAPRSVALQTLGGILAGLAAGCLCVGLTIATMERWAAAVVLTVAMLAAAVFLILQARKRDTPPFLRAFFVALTVVMLLCSACSGIVSVMSVPGRRIAG